MNNEPSSTKALELANIASRFHLSDSCISQLLKYCKVIAKEEFVSTFRSIQHFERLIGINRFPAYIHLCCPFCSKIFVRDYLKTPYNLNCCDHSFSQYDPQCLVYNIRTVMEHVIPLYNEKFCKNEKLKSSYFRSLYEEMDMKEFDISITLNTDGVPLFSSSNTSMWPVLAIIDNLEYIYQKNCVLLLGMWIARKGQKPDFKRLLDPIIAEIHEFVERPVVWTHKVYGIIESKVIVSTVSCDSIAKPPVQGLMQFNATYGCSYCLHKEGRHYFSHREEPSTVRTNADHRFGVSQLQLNDANRKGVVSASPLLGLDYFDIIKGK